MSYKKIKNMTAAILLGCAVLSQSCTSWLDITPEAQVNDKKIFSTPQGVKDVLNGIYITASGEKLYANNLLFGFTDVLAQYYAIPDETHEFAQLAKYQYKDVNISPKIDEMWLELYFCIANCNILLERLEEVGPDFFEDERTYYILHGEARALRAFFHFDLLRLFAPSYKADPGYTAIPYITKYSNKVSPQKTVSEVIDSVIVDLKAAVTDLEGRDPIFDPLYQATTGSDMYMWTQPMPDRNEFLSYRGFRLNYYAVNALLARVYAYKLDKKQAYDYAKIVLESGVFKFTDYWKITSDIQYRNRILRPEIVFGFNVPRMTKVFEPYSPSYSSSKKWLTIKNSEQMFEGSANDYRLNYLMEHEILAAFDRPSCIKFVKPENADEMTEEEMGRIAPMIRISEMYYYVCEYLMDSDLNGAKTELQKLRNARNAKEALIANSPAELEDVIVNDARREFMCEGQLFYFYKRLGRKVVDESGNYTMTEKDFVLPLPDVELEFGNRLSELYK